MCVCVCGGGGVKCGGGCGVGGWVKVYGCGSGCKGIRLNK